MTSSKENAMSTPANPTPRQVTQAQHPWRATFRSVVAFLIGLAAIWGLVIEAAGVDPTFGPVALSLAVAGGVTRILALPGVEALLRSTPFTAWLAAAKD